MATAKRAAPRKKARAKKAAPARKAPAKAKDGLKARIAQHLGVSEKEVEARALQALAAELGLLGETQKPAAPAPEPAAAPPESHYLPQRLFLLLDGRGLDGRGLPVEVIDLPCVIGSGKQCNVWINSPQIETRHLQITRGDGGWVIEDLGSERGTLIGDQRLGRRAVQNGDEYRLAGYLRLRTELR